jgi:hypothetical protein
MFGKNSKKQGDKGLGAAIAYFTECEYTVCVPLTDSQDYDLLVDTGEFIKRVQVRTTSYKKRSFYRVNLRVMGGNSKKNYIHKTGDQLMYDWLFVLIEDGTQYLIPKDELVAKSYLTLGADKSKYKIREGLIRTEGSVDAL